MSRQPDFKRQVEAMRLLGEGLSTSEVGAALKVSPRTVRRWRSDWAAGRVPPLDVVGATIWDSYLTEESSRARAILLTAAVKIAIAQAEAAKMAAANSLLVQARAKQQERPKVTWTPPINVGGIDLDGGQKIIDEHRHQQDCA